MKQTNDNKYDFFFTESNKYNKYDKDDDSIYCLYKETLFKF